PLEEVPLVAAEALDPKALMRAQLCQEPLEDVLLLLPGVRIGPARDIVEPATGGLSLFLQGAAGDINPITAGARSGDRTPNAAWPTGGERAHAARLARSLPAAVPLTYNEPSRRGGGAGLVTGTPDHPAERPGLPAPPCAYADSPTLAPLLAPQPGERP